LIAWASGRRGSFDLYVMSADGRRKQALATGAGDDVDPDWSPEGKRLVFSSASGGDRDLWIVDAEGGEPQLLLDLPGDERAPDWAPNGRLVAYAHREGRRAWVEAVGASGDGRRRLAAGTADTMAPSWSPTGRRLAVVSVRGGVEAVRSVSSPGGRPRALAGLGRGDAEPSWGTLAPRHGAAPRPGEWLPDLDQRAPRGLLVSAEGARIRLGFASAVDNVGIGSLRIRGVRAAGSPRMRALQLVALARGGRHVYRDVGRLRFTPQPPHYHWHFVPFESYELRRASDYALVARDRKAAFCLADHYGHAARRVEGRDRCGRPGPAR
jgi:dipeptidyl aminopeptidase/acylaminoacyl peptidase